ncbi:PEP/pyruvate-binding domain-containing protein [Streptomyces sp. MAR4 CNX-425]|uniref:PEP/pyruvate-binding domain-containing protein n=1 Tax=Streptomyces sp. MAR4 CNX-425 TaxID=3406343 RepID=UPI003B50BEBE
MTAYAENAGGDAGTPVTTGTGKAGRTKGTGGAGGKQRAARATAAPAARPPAPRARRAAKPRGAENPYRRDVVVLNGRRAPKTGVLGGKGAQLDELTGRGLPVPPAFCITTGAFRRFLDETGLAGKIRDLDRPAIRELVLAAPVPARLAELILDAHRKLGGPRVAVRSSAGKEDSGAQSFAGQHDSVLNVAGGEELLDAVKTCWASLWSDRAGVYRRPGEAGEPDDAMAVVVQEMVQAEVSGVLFTVDPVGGREHRMVVEACHGLGEGLVSGRVSSDFFVVDDRSLEVVDRRIRHKVVKWAPDASGALGMAKVEPTARSAPCLTEAQLAELGRLAVGIREHYGREQDVEWALRDGTFHLLQSRPVTAHAAPARSRSPYLTPQPDDIHRGTLWSRMDIGEIFVGLMTPLGLSWARYHQDNVHGPCAGTIGARDLGDSAKYIGHHRGHIYLNVSYHAHLLGQCPPTRDQGHFTKRFTSEEVDLGGYENPFGRYPGGLKGLRSANFWLRTTVAELRGMKRRAEGMQAARLYEFDRSRHLDLSRLDRGDLSVELERYLFNYHEMHVGYMPYYINAFGAYGLMTELCAKWLGDDGNYLRNHLKMDMSSLRTVESARELWTLTREAGRQPRVLDIIRHTPLAEVERALLDDPAGRAFWDAHIEPFLRMNGVRGHQEMELTLPRWVDDPSYIFQMMRRYSEDGLSVEDVLTRDHGETRRTIDKLLARLPRAKRATLARVIELYVTCSELREVARMAMITPVWQVRNVVYDVGRRLAAEGLLHSVDEVAYLDVHDIRDYLAGRVPAREVFVRDRIEEARRLHEHHRRQPEPALTFIGEDDSPPAPAAPASVTDGHSLRGLGASPGRAVGRARIIEDLTWQADELQQGEILVTRYTDASWTPLFAIAGAVVTDIGSMLSHSSIVSREFNLPSVVNTKHATQRINTGDTVVVDGDTGVVEIMRAGAAPGAHPDPDPA